MNFGVCNDVVRYVGMSVCDEDFIATFEVFFVMAKSSDMELKLKLTCIQILEQYILRKYSLLVLKSV